MPVQLVLADLPIQRVAVDAENFGGFRLITSSFAERGLNESLLEFTQSFI